MVRMKVNITDPPRVQIPSIDLEMSLQNEEMQKMNLYKVTESPPTDNDNDDSPKIWKLFVKNWPIISQPLAILFALLLLWGVGFSLLPDYAQPYTSIMRIIFLFIGAQFCGILIGLTGLPDMLGMLFWGVLYTNIGLGKFDGLSGLEEFLRHLALVNIMLLAGLGLDLDALKKLFGMVMRLTVIPTIAEVSCITVLSYFLLDLPWLWGILLGLVVTAVSPNVVVTVLLKLKEERLGLNKGIHTLIIAMTTLNDVIAIFLFGVLLGVIFSTGHLVDQLLQGPIGIGIGFVFGFVSGVFLLFMPSSNSKYVVGLRFTIMLLCGIFSVVGSKAIGYPSAGALGCVMTAFVAGTGWRKQTGKETNEVAVTLDLLWKFLKPISFSLIGKEVDFSVLNGNTVLYGTITLVIAVILRLLFSYLCAYGGDLNWKEKAYVTISGFPKATVQAALGPVALDMARKETPESLELSNTVLIISVLAIIYTAPIGAILMTKLSSIWLKRSQPSTESI